MVAVFLLFGSSSNPGVDPIAQAATVSSHAPGFRMHMSISMTSSALSGPITAYGDATVDPRDDAASVSFAMDLSSQPQVAQVLGNSTIRMNMIMSGATMYMELPQSLLGAVPSLGDKPWLKMNLATAARIPGLSSLGNSPTTSNPAQMLQYLRAASDGVANEGQQQVDGVPTTHYHAEISLDRLASGVPSADRSALAQALSKLQQVTGSADLPVDVWIDPNHLVRRMVMSLSLHPSSGPTMQETVLADLSDYGPQPRPSLPPADQVQDMTRLLSGAGLSG
jgi:hypothetical protein